MVGRLSGCTLDCIVARITACNMARWLLALRDRAATTVRNPEWLATLRPAAPECLRGASIVPDPVALGQKDDKTPLAKAKTVTPVACARKADHAQQVAVPMVNADPARITVPAMARVTEEVAVAKTLFKRTSGFQRKEFNRNVAEKATGALRRFWTSFVYAKQGSRGAF